MTLASDHPEIPVKRTNRVLSPVAVRRLPCPRSGDRYSAGGRTMLPRAEGRFNLIVGIFSRAKKVEGMPWPVGTIRSNSRRRAQRDNRQSSQ